jgi:hypothetical protein
MLRTYTNPDPHGCYLEGVGGDIDMRLMKDTFHNSLLKDARDVYASLCMTFVQLDVEN